MNKSRRSFLKVAGVWGFVLPRGGGALPPAPPA